MSKTLSIGKPGEARRLETADDFAETRVEAIGYVFHGTQPDAASSSKKTAARAGANLLHFARCNKLGKTSEQEVRIWFSSIRVAKPYLDDLVGTEQWGWCKLCQREITQKLLDE